MTQKEKAQAYDNVREKIAVRFGSNVAEEIFSEYEESEDEKIMKEIAAFFRKAAGGYLDTSIPCKTYSRWLAWLEKQGEQKLTDYSVWVGGSEVNDNYLTKEEAEKLADKYRKDGYEDVAIKKQN